LEESGRDCQDIRHIAPDSCQALKNLQRSTPALFRPYGRIQRDKSAEMQPGSSIMPGKVNPVIPEVVNQLAFEVIGMDVSITLAAEAGQLQLNVMEPLMAFELFMMLEMLKRGSRDLRERCVTGITANAARCREMVLNSIGIVTVLNPIIGYEKSAEIAKKALETGISVKDLVIEEELIDEEKLEELLSVENLMYPKFFRQ